MKVLKRCEGVIATDYSMLPTILPDQRNWNCARNRISAYYLETNGIPTIPVACWSGKEDFVWCFDGLPNSSTIAISTNGCLSSTAGVLTLLDGVEELVDQKNPSLLVVCGRKVPEIEDICENVMYYPSFSQRMAKRINHGK